MAEEKEFGAFYLCMANGCGDVAGRTAKKFCNLHNTAESRKQLTIENNKIQSDLKLKYPNGYENV